MNTRAVLPALVSTLAFPLFSLAQEGPVQRHEMATNQLKRAAVEISERCLTEIKSLPDWEKERERYGRELRDMLGLEPLPERTPLKVNVTGRLNREKYSIENVVFQSLPGLYVTGNLYLPKGEKTSLPTILYLCGHAPNPKGAKVHYQDRAAWFAVNGFACLILDTLEFGEVAGIHHGLHDLNMWHWLSLGYTPAGVEVWSAMRAIDYLETRPEVDSKRIGLTGISGGGAITWYTAAVDERVAAAAPVCSTYTFGSQATNWRAAGQCDCIYFHNTYGWDFPIVAALIAPRPLLMISGRRDGDFPPDGYREVFRRSKQIYDFYAGGNSDRVAELDDEVGHSDPPQFLKGAREWMQRWLQGVASPNAGSDAPPLEKAEDLACLETLPVDALNYSIHNRFVEAATLKVRGSTRAWEKRRAQVMEQLKEKVFRWFPTEKIPFETKVSKNTGGWTGRYADYQEVTFQTEPGVRVRAQVLRRRERLEDAPLLLYVKRPGDSIYFMDFDELLPVLGRYNVVILNPRFSEQAVGAAEYRDIAMSAAWSGRTVAALQLWDILRTVEWAHSEAKISRSSISFYGKGEMAVLGIYAALLDDRIGRVVVNAPPPSHWDGPALLNVLRVTDIPEAAGALAPRPLVSVTKLPEAFEHTRKIYRLQKASSQFSQAGSLPEALQVWREPGAAREKAANKK